MGIVQRIFGRDGRHKDPYLTRVVLSPRTRWGRLMLHVFHRGDEDAECHDHPWDFYTFPLHGYYEEVLDLEDGLRSVNYVPAQRWTFRRAEHAHRLIGPPACPHDGQYRDSYCDCWVCAQGEHRRYVRPFPLVTIVWIKERRNDWGFWCRPLDAYRLARGNVGALIGWNNVGRELKWVKVAWRTYVIGGKDAN